MAVKGAKTFFLTQSNGGIVNDGRTARSNVSRMVTNFDIYSNPNKLTPYYSSESGDTAASTSIKRNFCIGLWTITGNYRLFSLGVISGNSKAEVLMKDLGNLSPNSDMGDNQWLTPANNQQSTGSTASMNLFVYYKTTGKIYGARDGSNIWAFTPDGSTGWADTSHALSYTNIAQGLVHTDDILYVPYDNKIASKNGSASWNDTALTLPVSVYITSICSFGNFLGIATAPLSGIGDSQVYIWDTTSTSWNSVVNFGPGIVKVLESIENTLVGVSFLGGVASSFKDRVTFRAYDGVGAVKILEIVGTSSGQLPLAKQKIRNRIFFMMMLNINGSNREGVWSFGKDEVGGWSLSHERTPNNDTAITTAGILYNFFYVNDFLFQSYLASNTAALSKTAHTETYSHTSIKETVINPNMPPEDKQQVKQLLSIGATYEPLPSSGQVVVKYRINGGSWTTVFTETTDSAQYTEPVAKDATGTEFTSGKDIEFRIESTGGAEVTGLSYRYAILSSNV